jgi:Fur family iron response transcriptional regulator
MALANRFDSAAIGLKFDWVCKFALVLKFLCFLFGVAIISVSGSLRLRADKRTMFKRMQPWNAMALHTSNAHIRPLLEKKGLRATRQRLGLAKLLFSKGDRHVTADVLAAEAQAARMPASLATVYNVLNLFAEVGLVRGLAIEGSKTVFDTNTTDHCHFFYEESGDITDISARGMKFADEFEAPDGYEISKVDVVVRLRRKSDVVG